MIWDTRKEIWVWVALGVLFSGFSVWAKPIQVQVTGAHPQGKYELGVGSPITFRLPGKKKIHEGSFVGKLVNPDGTVESAMLVDQDYSKAFYVTQKDLDGLKLDQKAQPVLKLYDQVDNTCTGYAINNYLQQMRWLGFSSPVLDETLATEKGRAQLLVEAINNYYLAVQHHYSIKAIMNGFGKRFGFKCEMKTFSHYFDALMYLNSHLERQVPVMVSFNTGPDMVSSDIKLYKYPNLKVAEDERLWVPRKKGERNSGGHTIVAVSSFQFRGQEKLIMLDSDWDAPRIWDPEDYLSGKVAIDEIEFYTCE